LMCAVCMRPLAQRQLGADESWHVGAGGSAMASRMNERLVEAAKKGDVAGIAAAMQAGADPNADTGYGPGHPLKVAAIYGHVAAIAALLAAGARVDGSFGSKPLISAVTLHLPAVVAALLAAGADVNCASEYGNTALHVASRDGHLDASRALVEAGARTDVCDKVGKRPIDVVRALARSTSSRVRELEALPCGACAGLRGHWCQQVQRARPLRTAHLC
jgi:hypothetical protein